MKVRFGRFGVAVATGATVVLAGAGIASAHVTVDPGDGGAGDSTLVTFAFSHGCNGSPTTEVRIQIPESVPTVAPTMNAGWDVAKVMETLDPPIEGAHGEQLTERVAEVVYTAKTPVPDGYRDTFVLSLTLPDTPGEALWFPTIQTCEGGETAWIEIPADGQDHDDLDAPAPGFVIGEPAGGGEDDHDEGAVDTAVDAAAAVTVTTAAG